MVIAASANTTDDGATALELSWVKGGVEPPVEPSTTTWAPPVDNSTISPPPPGITHVGLRSFQIFDMNCMEVTQMYDHFQPCFKAASILVQDETVIYFATAYGGIKVYSEEANDVETFVNSTENLQGVAWDPKFQQLYFSTFSSPTSRIYRANADGTEVAVILNSSSG